MSEFDKFVEMLDNNVLMEKFYKVQMEGKDNRVLDKWYELLCKIGYVMSDEEKALLDGTHECFEEGE